MLLFQLADCQLSEQIQKGPESDCKITANKDDYQTYCEKIHNVN